jgi:hypothetical protein
MYVALKVMASCDVCNQEEWSKEAWLKWVLPLKVAGPPGKEKCLEHVKIIN